jgi:hypothetical protein
MAETTLKRRSKIRMDRDRQAEEFARLIIGETVRHVWRPKPGEIVIECADWARLFVNTFGDSLKFSVTGGNSN